MESQKFYTYSEAAPLLANRHGKPLTGRSAVSARIKLLAERGNPLTIAAGELVEVGARRLITNLGLESLRNFEFRKRGAKKGTTRKNKLLDTGKSLKTKQKKTVDKRTRI